MADTEVKDGAELDQETPDPGQLEGTRKDPREAQDEITPENPRFKEVYAKWKQSDRLYTEMKKEFDSLKGDTDKQNKLIEEMRKWNQELSEKIGGAITTIADAKSSDSRDDKVSSLQSSLEVLKTDYAEAIKDLDYNKAADLMDKITDVKLEIKDAKASPPKSDDKASSPPKPDPNLEPYVQFINSTEWYIEQPQMALYAQQLDTMLNSNPKWMGKPIPERLAEVKRLTEEQFGYKSSDNGENDKLKLPKASPVDSSRHSSSGNTNKVTLSSEEEELINGLGISREKFMAQKALSQKMSKRRTA